MPTMRIPYGVLDGRYVNTAGDTMIGNLTLSGAPTSNLHAATKQYVDDADAQFLKKDGSVVLTADWDIGDGRKMRGDELSARDGAGLKLYDAGGNGIFVKDGGYVGIGTSAPDYILHVKNSSGTAQAASDGATSAWSYYLIGGVFKGAVGYKGGSDNYFTIYESSGDRLIVKSGNVGIGTTGPDRKLDILDASYPQLRLTHTGGTVYTDFWTVSSGNLAILPSGGQVGINGIFSTSTFSVISNYNGGLAANITQNNTGGYGLRITPGNDGNYALLVQNAAETLARHYLYGNGNAFFSFNGGSTGIGTNSPSAKLAVNGGAHIGGDSDPGDNNLLVDGNVEIDGVLDHDGPSIGFFGITPVARAAAYAATNVTTDRAYDANATTLDELADVLGTLIADLRAYGLLQ